MRANLALTIAINFLRRLGIKPFLFIAFCFLLITKVNSQTTKDLTSCWTGSNCTSGDFTISKIYLASDLSGTALTTNSCSSPGAHVQVYLAIEFTNTTSSDRNGIFLSGNISSGGTSTYIHYCFNGLLPKKSVTRFVAPDPFIWICGQTITLENGFTGWNSASGPVCVNDPNNMCSGTTISKCRAYPSQVIQSPLVANFSFQGSCTTGAAYQTLSFTNLTTGGTTPYTYKWEYSTNGTTYTQFSTLASPTWSPNNSTTYYIKLTVTDKNGQTDSEIKTDVSAAACCTTPVVSGDPSSDTRCVGGSISFTASATGTPTPTVQWQEKVGAGSFTNISNGTVGGVTYSGATGTTLTISGLTASMNGNQYRAVFTTSSACSSANSNAATLTVNPTSVGGSVASPQTICSGSQLTSSLTLSGNTGSVVKWQKSTTSDFSSGVTDIANTSTTLTAAQAGTLTQDTWFRAVVKSGVCDPANSNAVKITVDPPSVGGTAGSPQTICSGSQPTSDLSVSGITGSVTKWQKSIDNFASNVSDISSSASSTLSKATIGALTQDTWFRAVVQSGVCATANSSVVKISVNPTSVGGSVASPQTICSGSQLTSSLTLSGNTGSVVKWQKSTTSDFSSGVTDIANTSTTLTAAQAGTLTQDTWFRAVVKSGVCDPANSNAVKITVGAIPEKPAFTVAQPSLCGNAKGAITICQSVLGFDYTVAGVTKSGTGSTLTFGDLAAGSNPKLSVVNTTGGCSAPQDYSCDDATDCSQKMTTKTSQAAKDQTDISIAQNPSVKAYPNPFGDRINFLVNSPVSGKGSLEVYNALGQKVRTVFQGNVAKGAQSYSLHLPLRQQANLVYVLRVGEKQVSGKILQLNR